MTPENGDNEVAKVVMRPPTLFLLGLLAACVLELVKPLGPGLAQGNWKAIATGFAVVLAGLAIGASAVRRFRAAGTTIQISEPTEALVTHGIFALTRNPIYIGLITVYVGIAVMLTSLWALILLPALVAVLHKGVVLREEAFLERKFGDAYRAYKKKVPRWL